MRNLTSEEIKQVKDLANELDEKTSEFALFIARLRRECEAFPGMRVDPVTGEWKMEK